MCQLNLASGNDAEFASVRILQLTTSLTRIIFNSERFAIYLSDSCMLLKKVIFIH